MKQINPTTTPLSICLFTPFLFTLIPPYRNPEIKYSIDRFLLIFTQNLYAGVVSLEVLLKILFPVLNPTKTRLLYAEGKGFHNLFGD